MAEESKYTVVLSDRSEFIGVETEEGLNQLVVRGDDIRFSIQDGSLHVTDGDRTRFILAPGMWEGVREDRPREQSRWGTGD